MWKTTQQNTIHTYEKLLDMGMAKEQARSILPLTVYTKVWWTASFQSIMNFIELRDEKTSLSNSFTSAIVLPVLGFPKPLPYNASYFYSNRCVEADAVP